MRGFGWVMRRYRQLFMILRAATLEPRRSIVEILSSGDRRTSEIIEELSRRGIYLPRTTLYYHLSILEGAGIISMIGYQEVGGGAPEKIWHLNAKYVKIGLVDDSIMLE